MSKPANLDSECYLIRLDQQEPFLSRPGPSRYLDHYPQPSLRRCRLQRPYRVNYGYTYSET